MLNWLARYAFVVDALRRDHDGALAESVLDVGCGPHGLACALPHVKFAGVDTLFPGQVAPGMTAFRTEPGPLPFADASFDTIVCLDVLEHIPAPDRSDFVKELARVAAGRVLLACPTDESEWVQDVLRVEFAVRRMPLPLWLNEHDEHGLPSAAEVRDICTTVSGFDGDELQMVNGLLATLVVLADVLPEFAAEATTEFRENPQPWLDLFSTATFGHTRRRGYALTRVVPANALVSAKGLFGDSVWAATRCPACSNTGLFAAADGAVCASCQHRIRREPSNAFDLTLVGTN